MSIPQPQGCILQDIDQPLVQGSHRVKHWEEYVGMLGLVPQSKSSNSLVLILHRKLDNYLLSTGESYNLRAQNIHKTLYR